MNGSVITDPIFTAREIADRLFINRKTVLGWLSRISPDGQKLSHDRIAYAWRISSLPAQVKTKLEEARQRNGFRTIADFLSGETNAFKSPVPLDRIDKRHIEKAISLREALRTAIEQRNKFPMAEVIEIGLRDYKRTFGFSVSERHWRRIFDKVIQRDGGAEQWTRIDIYLEEIAFNPPPKRVSSMQALKMHEYLEPTYTGLAKSQKLEPQDKAFAFHVAFEHFDTVIAGETFAASVKQLKSSLTEFMFLSLPGIAKNLNALKRVFDIKYKAWKENGCSFEDINDKRRLNSGRKFKLEFEADIQNIIHEAIDYDGNIALAYRQLWKRSEPGWKSQPGSNRTLSKAFRDHYQYKIREYKSRVPDAVMERVRPGVERLVNHRRGPKYARSKGPWIMRDWGDVFAGQWFVADDVTLNNFTYSINESGQLWIGRPECLVMTDLRTWYYLGHYLFNEHYTSRHIFYLIARIHENRLLGLPNKGFYFENGIWRSQWITGCKDQPGCKHMISPERALNDPRLGLTVRHALPGNPRSKPIERHFGIIQELQRSQPGYVGHNERTDKREGMQDFIRRCKVGKEHPGNELLEFGKWNQLIADTFAEIAEEPQNGKMLRGVSPKELWQHHQDQHPEKSALQRLPESMRFLLDSHQETVRVGTDGIRIQISRDRYLYCNEQTQSLTGQTVRVRYNMEYPKLLSVENPKDGKFFSVPCTEAPAMGANKDDFKRVNGSIHGHSREARKEFGTMEHQAATTITRMHRFSESEIRFGKDRNEAIEDAKTKQASEGRKKAQIDKLNREMGFVLNGNIRNSDTVLEGTKLEMEARRQIEEIERLEGKEDLIDE